MKIGGLQKTTLIDFPDQLAAIVFIKGCNFRCPFCYNRDLVMGKTPTISQASILSFLGKRRGLLTGVVVTGGEPLFQEGLEKFFKKLKKLNYLIKLDTNGSLPVRLKKLLDRKFLDYVALDIKASLDKNYGKIIGKPDLDINLILQTIKLLLRSGVPFELRTTIAPKIHNEKVLVQMAEQLKKVIGKRKVPWFWQNFQPKTCLNPKFEKIKPYKREKLEEFLKDAKKYYSAVELRGL